MPYKCRWFKIRELVAPEIVDLIGEDAAWRLIPPEVVYGLDSLRDAYGGPMFINEPWKKNGRTNSGVRAITCIEGAQFSGHKLFRGETCFDIRVKNPVRFESIVIQNHVPLGIGRMENPAKTPGWRHISFVKGAQTLDIFDP